MAKLGADTESLEQLARSFQHSSNDVGVASAGISSLVASAVWKGPDAERFRQNWIQQRRSLIAVSNELDRLAETLQQQAAQQREASGESTKVWPGGVTATATVGAVMSGDTGVLQEILRRAGVSILGGGAGALAGRGATQLIDDLLANDASAGELVRRVLRDARDAVGPVRGLAEAFLERLVGPGSPDAAVIHEIFGLDQPVAERAADLFDALGIDYPDTNPAATVQRILDAAQTGSVADVFDEIASASPETREIIEGLVNPGAEWSARGAFKHSLGGEISAGGSGEFGEWDASLAAEVFIEGEAGASASIRDGRLVAGADASLRLGAEVSTDLHAELYGVGDLDASATASAVAEAEVAAGLEIGPDGVDLSAGGRAAVSADVSADATVTLGDAAHVTGEYGVGVGLGVEFDAGAQFGWDEVGVDFEVGAWFGIGGSFDISVGFSPREVLTDVEGMLGAIGGAAGAVDDAVAGVVDGLIGGAADLLSGVFGDKFGAAVETIGDILTAPAKVASFFNGVVKDLGGAAVGVAKGAVKSVGNLAKKILPW